MKTFSKLIVEFPYNPEVLLLAFYHKYNKYYLKNSYAPMFTVVLSKIVYENNQYLMSKIHQQMNKKLFIKSG